MTYDNVRRAARLAMLAGANFIKTSTGTVSPASSPGHANGPCSSSAPRPSTPSSTTLPSTQAIDRWVWYAGSDKLAQALGGVNPVTGPFLNISAPEPTGAVAALAPQRSSLPGLVSGPGAIAVSGNTAVVLPSEHGPLRAVTLSEVRATSAVPAGPST